MRTKGGRVGLALLAGYAASTAAAGVLLATASWSGPGPAPSATGPAGRPVSAAPVLPGRSGGSGPPTGPDGAGGGSNGNRPGAGPSAPDAQVARGTVAGSPFRPTQLVLPGGVTATVITSGVHPDGALVIPEDPAVVGWWSGGALAGDAFGGVVIAGHVDSARFGLGVLARLRTVRTGELVELRTPGRSRTYRITERLSVPQAELAGRGDTFRQDVEPRLVLITCGGRFDPARHRYQENLIIYARPVS